MSASRTPVRWPRVENAAARFAVRVDLPTPPFPLAIARTRVALVERDSLRALADAAAELLRQRGLLVRAHDVELELDGLRRPRAARSSAATCSSKLARSGQPATVSAIVMVTAPPSMRDVAHHVELGDRAPELRVDHLLERLVDLVAESLHRRRAYPKGAKTPCPFGTERVGISTQTGVRPRFYADGCGGGQCGRRLCGRRRHV